MLLVKTYVAPSTIHGLGLFAAEDIPAGTTYWKENLIFEPLISSEEFEKLPEATRSFIDTYGWREQKDGPWRLSRDNARFTNHSDTPNLRRDVTLRDIKSGEELTEHYGEYDADWEAWAADHLGRTQKDTGQRQSEGKPVTQLDAPP